MTVMNHGIVVFHLFFFFFLQLTVNEGENKVITIIKFCLPEVFTSFYFDLI